MGAILTSPDDVDGPAAPVLRATSGVILDDPSGRILLIRRAQEDTWGIPGGGVEPGESWADAAVRECREETGWEARIDGLLGVYSDPVTQVHRYPSGSLRQFVGVVFLATAVRRVGPVGEEPPSCAGSPPTTCPNPSSRPTARCCATPSTRTAAHP